MKFLKQSTVYLGLFAVTIVPLNNFFHQTRFELSSQFDEVRLQLDKALPDEILVKFKDESAQTETKIVALTKKLNLSTRSKSSSGVVRFGLRNSALADTLAILNSEPNIAYAEPNYRTWAFSIPNDAYFAFQWNFAEGKLNLQAIHEISTGNSAIVAVIDSGVAFENYLNFRQAPDLSQTKFVSGYDFINNDSHPNDDNGHGTHVTGTIAQSTNNRSGVAGLAPNASIMPVKVLDKNGGGNYYAVSEGIRFAADNGAHVINLSLGGPVTSKTLEDAIVYAYNKGVLIVAAAGNDGNRTLSYPAAYSDYVLAVGAVDMLERTTPYSNTGAGLDLVTYGGDLRTDYNRDGYKDGILQQTISGSPSNFGYLFFQGTSMAAPHVSASAALLVEKGITGTKNLTEKLISSATDLGINGYDTNTGYGLLNPLKALELLNKAPVEPVTKVAEPVPLHQEAQTSGTPMEPEEKATVKQKYLRIGSFTMDLETSFLRNYAKAVIIVVDEQGNPVSGAQLEGNWTGLVRGRVRETTDQSGRVEIWSRPSFRRYGEIEFSVDELSKSETDIEWIFENSERKTDSVQINSLYLNFSLTL